MGFMDRIKSGFDAMSSGLQAEAAKIKNRSQAEATLAIMALVSAADGEIEDSERKAGARFVRDGDLFQAFDRTQLAATLETFYAKAADAIVQGDLYAVVRKVKGTDGARDVMRLGLKIALADGTLEAEEIDVLREVCASLGIDPAEFRELAAPRPAAKGGR